MWWGSISVEPNRRNDQVASNIDTPRGTEAAKALLTGPRNGWGKQQLGRRAIVSGCGVRQGLRFTMAGDFYLVEKLWVPLVWGGGACVALGFAASVAATAEVKEPSGDSKVSN